MPSPKSLFKDNQSHPSTAKSTPNQSHAPVLNPFSEQFLDGFARSITPQKTADNS